MKHWLMERFLPMWAKETLWRDYRALRRENARLRRQILQKEAYIKGLHKAFSLRRRCQSEGLTDEVLHRSMPPHQSPAATASPRGEAFEKLPARLGGSL